MQFKHKLAYIALGGMLLFVGLLGTASISLAQGDAWTTKADMPTARQSLSTAVVDGRIYAIGGAKDASSAPFSAVEEYDLATDTWTTKTDMPTARFFLSTSAVNDKIYAIGGSVKAWPSWQACSTLEEYDPGQTSVEEGSEATAVPLGYALFQNYPNPFNPQTVIRYDLPEPGAVRLSMYNVLGQMVRTLVDGRRSSGTYSVTWDGRDGSGRDVASGVYLYRLEVGGQCVQIRKMVLLR